MRTRSLTLLIAAALLILAGPAAAASPTPQARVDADVISGFGVLSDNTIILLSVLDGTVTIPQTPPTPRNSGSLTTIDVSTHTQTQVSCLIQDVASDCTQANILCEETLVPHHIIGAICLPPPSGSGAPCADPARIVFNGSIDGIDVRNGLIVLKCLHPAASAPTR
jgi:hypothetical protein